VVGKFEPAFKNIHNGDVLKSSSQNAVIVNVLESPNENGTIILKDINKNITFNIIPSKLAIYLKGTNY
jgi:hypothetical protein